MGRNKLLLRSAGETLAHRAARCAIEAGLEPLIVVVGNEADLLRAALSDLRCTFVYNPSFRAATSGSLHLGLERLPPDAAGAVVLLADMVNVTGAMIRAVRDAADESTPLAVSRYGGEVLAPPHLFRRVLFPELLAWSGEGAGRAVARRHLRSAAIVDWPAEALKDIDTPADLAGLE